MADFVAAAPAVSALLGDRFFQLRLPQSPVYPCGRVQVLYEPVLYTHDGPMNLRRAHVQIDAFDQESSGSDPYDAVTTLASAIDTAVSGYIGPMGDGSPQLDVRGVQRLNRMPTYDPDELRVVRIIQTYDVWYRAA